MINKRRAQHLFGEAVMDIGILVFVFGPLDAIYQEASSWAIPLSLAFAGLSLMAAGIIFQAWETVT